MKNRVSIFFNFLIWCAWIGITHASTSITSVTEFLDTEDSSHYTPSLKAISREGQVERFWQYQQRIEEAHSKNNTNTIEQIYREYLPSIASEQSWQWLSEDILRTSNIASQHWQNWYSRWQKWEVQSTWSEAVLSALFFPLHYYYNSSHYGDWSGNASVEYSLAISAYYNNPQAKLCHASVHGFLYKDDEVVEDFERNTFNNEIRTSHTEMGQELAAIASTNRMAAKNILERLSDRSVTARYALIAYVSKEQQLQLAEETGECGLSSGYLKAAALAKTMPQKLKLLEKVPGIGNKLKWVMTKNIDDRQAAIEDYLCVAENGDARGYLEIGKILIASESDSLSYDEKIRGILYLQLACRAGIPYAVICLSSMISTHFSRDEQDAYKSLLIEMNRESNARYSDFAQRILDLNIIK